jgi:nucleotide-binding universal stress UspA family protein
MQPVAGQRSSPLFTISDAFAARRVEYLARIRDESQAERRKETLFMKTVKLNGKRRAAAASEKTAAPFAPKRILVPVDFSQLSRAALDQALQIASQFGASVTLFHAVEPIIQPVEFAIVPSEMEEVNMIQMQNARKQLEAIAAEKKTEQLARNVQVKLGKPWHAIVDEAARIKADLIVISTHGRTGLKHALMGSTAERVVQHAPCSVLVVR